MEEILEGAIKGILKLASLIVRSLVWLILELFFDVIGWYVGWPIIRVLTFGRYPAVKIQDHDQAPLFTQCVVAFTGLISLLALGAVLAKLIFAMET